MATPKKDEAPAGLTADDVQTMIDAALAKIALPSEESIKAMVVLVVDETMPGRIDAALAKIAIPSGDDVSAWVQKAVDKIDVATPFNDAVRLALAEWDFGPHIDKGIADREQRIADAAADAQRAVDEAAAAEQRNARGAAKRAEKAAKDAEDAADAKRQRAVDRAKREYQEMLGHPVASPLGLFEEGTTVELRFANGETFLPDFAIDENHAGHWGNEGGRPVYLAAIDVPDNVVPFTVTEAVVIVEGIGKPLSVWRSPTGPIRVGGGSLATFPAGSLAFRRVSPEPVAEDAAAATA